MIIDSEPERAILSIRTSEVWGQTMHYLDIHEEDIKVIAEACDLNPKLRGVLDRLVLAAVRAEKEAMEHIDMLIDGAPRSTIRPTKSGRRTRR